MPGRKMPEEVRREDILRAAYDVAARQGVEALTVRAVAERANLSHGTVLFHFKRRDDLVAELLERVLHATAVLRAPEAVQHLSRPIERMHAILRAEMDRLSAEPRHFRLFLEYWTLGVRRAAVRRKISTALDGYRTAFRMLAETVLNVKPQPGARGGVSAAGAITAEGVAAVAVSLVHGCALQAVIEPRDFDVEQHFDAAAQMLERLAASSNGTSS